MDWSDFGDWLTWLLLAAAFLFMASMALMTIVVGVYQVIRCVQAHRRGCSSSASVVDELLREIILKDDIPPGDEAEREWCAICVTPYESGEACSVLPACTHMFHKPCVAKWLRKRNTCPLCRATVLRPPAVVAADDMV